MTSPASRPVRSSSATAGTALGVDRQTGVLAWLTVYLILLFGIPSRLVFHPLGSAGAPSTLFGLASALVWFLAQLWRSASVSGPRRPVRIALTCFLLAVGVSYVAAMSRPIDSDEISPADIGLLAVVAWSGALLTAQVVVLEGVAQR